MSYEEGYAEHLGKMMAPVLVLGTFLAIGALGIGVMIRPRLRAYDELIRETKAETRVLNVLSVDDRLKRVELGYAGLLCTDKDTGITIQKVYDPQRPDVSRKLVESNDCTLFPR
jgi:hypothetical protein